MVNFPKFFSIILCVIPDCGLYVVGSSMNGFGNITSDMDMCLMLSQSEVGHYFYL